MQRVWLGPAIPEERNCQTAMPSWHATTRPSVESRSCAATAMRRKGDPFKAAATPGTFR